MVCVHGAGVSSRQTLPLLKEAAGRREAWALDLPGFGRSTAADRRPTVPKLADALLEWLRHRRLDQPCLLGASLGTQVVAEVAVRAPDEVGSVVLVGPTVDPAARSLGRLAARLLRNNLHEGMSVVTSSFADYRDAGPRRVLRSWEQSRRHRIERVLPGIRQPALVLRGQKDAICPKAWAEEAARLLPRGRLVTVPGQPHALTSADPAQVLRLVDGFAREVAQ
ncbi:alpha/beta hydrolase [Nocardiopsis nanhaiensis]